MATIQPATFQGTGSQQRAFDAAGDGLVFASDHGHGKQYHVCAGYHALYDFVFTQPPERRCYYEMVRPHMPVKLYFDLDLKGRAEDVVPRMNAIQDALVSFVNLKLLEIYDRGVDDDDVLVLTSDGSNKASRHIIWQVYFKSVDDVKAFVYKYVVPRFADGVDKGVYTKNRCFRLFGNRKNGSDRVLKSRLSDDSESTQQRVFRRSLLTTPPSSDTNILTCLADGNGNATDSDCCSSSPAPNSRKRGRPHAHATLPDLVGADAALPAITSWVNEFIRKHEDVAEPSVRRVRDAVFQWTFVRTAHKKPCLLGGCHEHQNMAINVDLASGAAFYKCYGENGHPLSVDGDVRQSVRLADLPLRLRLPERVAPLPTALKSHLTPNGSIRSDYWNPEYPVRALAPEVYESSQAWVEEREYLKWMARGLRHDDPNRATIHHPNAVRLSYKTHVKDTGECGDAKVLKHLFGGERSNSHPRALFDPSDHSWYIWDGNVFVPDVDRRITVILHEYLLFVYGQLCIDVETRLDDVLQKMDANKNSVVVDKVERGRLEQMHHSIKAEHKTLKARQDKLCTQRHIKNVLSWAQTVMSINQFKVDPHDGDEQVWDKSVDRIGCANGVMDLRQGKLVRGHPREFVRKSIPTKWDSAHDAWVQNGAGPSPCPTFEAFVLETVSGNVDVALYLQKFFGYGMTGRGDLQRMLFMYGARGGNGKSEKLKALQYVLGRLCKPIDKEAVYDTRGAMQSAANGHKQHIVNLLGKHLCVVSEAGPKNFLGDNFRRMTGGFKLSARGCGESKQTEFDPSQTYVGDTNLLPQCDGAEDAVVRRLDVVHYNCRWVDDPSTEIGARQRVQDYAQKFLFPEASGILAWLARGYQLFLVDEEATGGLSVPHIMTRWKDEWIAEVDPIHSFFKECVVAVEASSVPAHELHVGYQKWCVARHKNNGLNGPIGFRSVAGFGRRITKLHGPGAKHTSTGSIYEGLTFSQTYMETYSKVAPPFEE